MTITDTTVQLPTVDISEERLLRLTAELAAHAEKVDRDSSFPWEGLQAAHDAGLLTAAVGKEHGGYGGFSAVDTVRVFRALGKGDPSVALLVAMTYVAHGAFASLWPAELYGRVLAESAQGPTPINAIRAEPELGAPARGGLPATTVRRTPDGWVLNGHKGFATGSEGLAYHLVWAVSEDEEPIIGHVIVPSTDGEGNATPGIRIERTWDHLGMRGTSTHDVIYTDVHVPVDHFVGVPVGTVPNNAGPNDGAILGVFGLYLGVAEAARDFFGEFARTRVPTALGRPIATTERIQGVAGEIEAHLATAQSALHSAAVRVDAGDTTVFAQFGLAKVIASRASIAAVETAVAALGNPALTRSNPLERHLRDVLCSRIHPPQDDTALVGAGRIALA
ncbi:MAG: Acyl-CoA dehydrogenase type 2 domain [Nocardioidaceae bacterium]|nr:Acyl-CoA dehydrogenase type 2 domain [Nocardioidaceae bacterium]